MGVVTFNVVVVFAGPREDHAAFFLNHFFVSLVAGCRYAAFARTGDDGTSVEPRCVLNFHHGQSQFLGTHLVDDFIVSSRDGRGVSQTVFGLHRVRNNNRHSQGISKPLSENFYLRIDTGAAVAENHCGIGFGLSFEFFYGSDFRSTAGIRQNDIGIQPSGSQCLGSVSTNLALKGAGIFNCHIRTS